MQTVNWGVLATGRIAETFAKALAYSEDSRTLAVASRSYEKAKKFATDFGFERAYGSYEELVADPDVDIIYIATPMSCHFENAKLCIENGKNILLEKAVTINSKQLDELTLLAKKNGVFFMEAMWMKCLPAFRKALEWKNNGAIGNVQMVKADFCNAVALDPSDRLFDKRLGGGALLDLGVYTITFATAFLGNSPTEITSLARMGATGADFDNAIMLRYPQSFAVLTNGFDILCKNNAVVIGDRGRIEFGDWFFCTGSVRLVDDNGKVLEEFNNPHELNGYEYEIREAQECLRCGLLESSLIPLCETASVMKIMDECRRQWGFCYEGEQL